MAEISEGDRAIIAALELLRARVTQLPLAIAQNAAMAAAEAAQKANPQPAAEPSQGLFGRNLGRVGAAADLLAARFRAMLGPLATFSTYLNAPTSGMSVLSKAINLFAASVAPVILPATYMLSVALTAASEVVFKKLVPALDGFYKLVLSTGIPAIRHFVSMIGRATEALASFADTAVGKAVLSSDGRGGRMGAIDRLTGGQSEVVKDTGNGGFTDQAFAQVKSAQRTLNDFARSVLPVGGETLTDASTWASKKAAGIFGPESAGDPYSGRGTKAGTGDGLATGAVKNAQRDVLKELMLSMGPRASSGSVSSVWSKAQMATLNQSPFERRMLEMMTQVVTTMAKADATTAAPDRRTESERR